MIVVFTYSGKRFNLAFKSSLEYLNLFQGFSHYWVIKNKYEDNCL